MVHCVWCGIEVGCIELSMEPVMAQVHPFDFSKIGVNVRSYNSDRDFDNTGIKVGL